MIVRHMKESEVAAVSKLLGESYEWLGERQGLSPRQIEFLLSARGSIECLLRESAEQEYLVAQVGGELAGMAGVSGNEITKLYVRPSCMGAGVGLRLYQASESIIRSAGHRRVVLGAFESAVPFYERMGLHAVGTKDARGPLAGVVVTLMEKRLPGRSDREGS
jgi:GNAT superfamily N-acetyltransferase